MKVGDKRRKNCICVKLYVCQTYVCAISGSSTSTFPSSSIISAIGAFCFTDSMPFRQFSLFL